MDRGLYIDSGVSLMDRGLCIDSGVSLMDRRLSFSRGDGMVGRVTHQLCFCTAPQPCRTRPDYRGGRRSCISDRFVNGG